jgi:predicted Zn-dependent peptidase
MTFSIRRRAALALLLLAAAFGPSALAQQAPDRSKPPGIGQPPPLNLPPLEKRTLTNGLPVWIVRTAKVPVAHLQLVVRGGTGADPVQKFGIASLTADMLDEGAGKRTALEIADAVDYLGAELASSAASDASYVDLHVPVARLADALPIMADVVVRPTFPESEVKRLRDERLTSLLQAQDDPDELIELAFPRLLFGPAHRYGTASIGTAAALKGFTVEDLKAFHAAQYRPGNAVLIATGDLTADVLVRQLEQTLGSWTGAASTMTKLAEAASPTGRRVVLIDKPQAAQSQIRIGTVGVPRSTPDFFALRVLNTILGGSFTSRLNANLREQHGYAYGARSTFDMRRAAGPFYAAAGVQTDKTADALKEFFNELTRIHETVPPDELEKAKNYLALALPRSFETTREMASSLAQLYVYDLPEDFYATYRDRVRAITAADVKRAADRYIVPDKLLVVIVGDLKIIEPAVRALNLGPVSISAATDVMK